MVTFLKVQISQKAPLKENSLRGVNAQLPPSGGKLVINILPFGGKMAAFTIAPFDFKRETCVVVYSACGNPDEKNPKSKVVNSIEQNAQEHSSRTILSLCIPTPPPCQDQDWDQESGSET